MTASATRATRPPRTRFSVTSKAQHCTLESGKSKFLLLRSSARRVLRHHSGVLSVPPLALLQHLAYHRESKLRILIIWEAEPLQVGNALLAHLLKNRIGRGLGSITDEVAGAEKVVREHPLGGRRRAPVGNTWA